MHDLFPCGRTSRHISSCFATDLLIVNVNILHVRGTIYGDAYVPHIHHNFIANGNGEITGSVIIVGAKEEDKTQYPKISEVKITNDKCLCEEGRGLLLLSIKRVRNKQNTVTASNGISEDEIDSSLY